MNFPGEKPLDTLTLDIYPEGHTSFVLYEDDGRTRKALEQDAFAKTEISCVADSGVLRTGGAVEVKLEPTEGSYQGQLAERGYNLHVHTPELPSSVAFNSAPLERVTSLEDLDKASS